MSNTITSSEKATEQHGLFTPANYINGTWKKEGDGSFNTVVDKYHGTELTRIPHATAAQMEEAIAAAYTSRATVHKLSAGERNEKLEALAKLIEKRADKLAMLIVQEAGKPIGYAKGEIARCITTVRTAAAEALRFTGEMTPIDFGAGAGKTAFTKRFPIGVIGAITPFNFPLNLVLHKVAPAMATGCPVVLKPAPQAPLSALALAAMMEEIGWPKGAFSVLLCGNPVAELLVKDERVAMLSFTGSDKVGWHLKAICGKKKVALELGGNAAVIIDEGTDLAAAAKSVAMGANLYAGQTCISTQRIFVVKPEFEKFRDLLVKEYKALKAGDPADASVSVGPIIDKGHFERIGSWLDEAVKGGAKLLAGGKPVDPKRNVFAATLLTDTKHSMKVDCAEVFGPIAVVESVKDFAAGIARVNDSNYGLQAGVFTNNFNHVKKAHEELEVGGVIINSIPGFRVDSMPYGGIKDSGLGREGLKYAMEEMSEPRLIVY
ncbi:MAG: aldehyde dehydrogenase family protein [Flavobacteriales bacterium]|jgi:glyceraldehyde-3-phosphate dehydrogenase (NADP+)|nr:aldehyde dehydrogenase family protein [Flavobacteriales bacterium]MBK7247147.1 aldehyde dehydrogenase family protein [Flavobacteriales bacterium]MBK7288712.1 aldehyde dehydrogenase family protein [Flavobacteriales bacterium]MBK9060231.1 aldehyde dehydrogenase family protein [Flavobacteriales bacterium]MBK9598884.1 aldehyde dehydrogenase family protein [Flavobacteriales bacterium]